MIRWKVYGNEEVRVEEQCEPKPRIQGCMVSSVKSKYHQQVEERQVGRARVHGMRRNTVCGVSVLGPD